MNEEEYLALKKERAELLALDWGQIPEGAVESVDYRLRCLNADIFGYEHPDVSSNPYEAGLNQ